MYKVKNILISLSLLITFAVSASEECKPGYGWDSNRNRCVLTQSSLDNREEYKQCEDAESEEAKSTCIESEAKKRASTTRSEYGDDVKSDDVNDIQTKGQVTSGLMSALSILTAIQAYAMKDSISGAWEDTALSVKIFMGTSLAGFIKTAALEKDVEDETDKLKSEFETEVADKSSMKDAQLRSFDYLEKEQSYLEKHSKEQKSLYNMMAMGYTAASIAAAYDIYSGEGFKSCAGTEVTKGVSWFGSAIKNPCWILGFGLVSAGYAYSLGTEASEHAKEASSNVSEIKKLKEKYVVSIANFCPDGREDLKKPYCYCYLSGGDKNPNREKSGTCQAIWAEATSLYAQTTDFIRGGGNKYKSGCAYVDGKFDANCDCKKLKNSSGQNACMKTNMPKSVLSSFGNLNTSPATNSINNILSGDTSPTAIETSVNDNTAIAKNARDAIIKKLDPAVKKGTGLSLDQIGNKMPSILNKSIQSRGIKLASLPDASKKMSGLRPKMPEVRKALIKSGSKGMAMFRGGKSLKSSKKVVGKKKNKFFSFGDSSSSGSDVQNFPGEDKFMKKKYKYSNDINNDKSVSIFKVISNRYSQSGLKRLFSDDQVE
ncbi:MAG: hypothetical protein BM556_10175 [Bacteriovorax sp. MedPE-SWde]|nr:MAG: hypothetical protein BM556_10175 [Bacteriovorax sp. MedPE-SWde]